MSDYKSVGHSVNRKDARDKLTGKAKYPQDIDMEGMIYGHTLRSEIPCGTFEMDLTEAEASEGVIKILTAADVTGHNHHGVLFKDHEVLCSKKVRRIGDPMAVVIAETETLAIQAVSKIKVTYHELPAVFDAEDALQEGAPQVHDEVPNLIYHYKCHRGDVEQAFKDSHIVVENVYETPFVDHAFLQLESGVAYLDKNDRVIVKAASQYPHFDRLEVAEAIGWEEDKVIIDNPAVGGAFGGREDLTLQAHLALAAIKTRRPVKISYSREESFYAHSKRHPIRIYVKTGADKDGKLTACEARLYGDTGAYASWAINVLRKAGVHMTGPYEIPNVKIDSYAVYTNNPFAGAMRGFGATQVPVAYEQQMDELANALGMSPYEIRMKNIFRQGSMTANGQVLISSVPLEQCLNAIWDAMNEEGAEND